jgi:hypothetical protein
LVFPIQRGHGDVLAKSSSVGASDGMREYPQLPSELAARDSVKKTGRKEGPKRWSIHIVKGELLVLESRRMSLSFLFVGI